MPAITTPKLSRKICGTLSGNFINKTIAGIVCLTLHYLPLGLLLLLLHVPRLTHGPTSVSIYVVRRLPKPPLRRRRSRPTFLCRGKNHPRPSTPPPAVPIARDWEYNHAHRRRRVARVDTSSPAIARTFTPCIQAISSRSGVFVVVETATKIILEHKKFKSFLYSPPFCGVSRAVTDHHLCSQRILCSAHARTRTGVN